MEIARRLRHVVERHWRTGEDESAIHLEPGEAHRLLAVERRRHVIEFLANDVGMHEETDIAELSRYVAARENGVEEPDGVSSAQRQRAYVSLYQQHLGELQKAQVIEWDERSGAVRRGKSVEELDYLIQETRRACSPARYLPDYTLAAQDGGEIATAEMKAGV